MLEGFVLSIALEIAKSLVSQLVSIWVKNLGEKLDTTPEEPTPRVEIKDAEIIEKIKKVLRERDDINNDIKNDNEKMKQLIQQVLSEVKTLSERDPDLEVASDGVIISQLPQGEDKELDSTDLTDWLKRIEKRLDEIAATRLTELIPATGPRTDDTPPSNSPRTPEPKQPVNQHQMSVTIELAKSHLLRIQEDNPSFLLLPAIEIKPTDNSNLPHIFRIDISASGMPKELVEQIQSVYKSFNFGTNNLFKLSTPRRLRQSSCKWNKPLPTDVNCTLQVTVGYYDSDTMGTANVFASPQQATAVCNIWTASVQELPDTKPEEKTVEEDEVEGSEMKTPSTDSVQESSVKEKELEKTIPVTKVEPDENNLGWLAIDFGTSNSTVTLYEPKFVIGPKPWFSEPEERLSARLAHWLTQRPKDNLAGVSSSNWDREWEKLHTQLSKNFPEMNQVNFKALRGEQLLEAIRQLEITLNDRQPWFCSAASSRLNQIYQEVFGIPLLEWQSLIKVQLDKGRGSEEIPSELEIVELEPSLAEDDPKKVKVLLGYPVRSGRINAIKKGEEIQGRFFHSPKGVLEKDEPVEVTLKDQEDKISVNKLIQAAYAQLIELTNHYRKDNPNKCNQGKFYRAVVTYPSIISPFARLKIKDSVEKLGIDDVRIAYDEAVSVAIFFLWKKFGGNLNIGIESFKTRCYRDGSKWWQNVLVLDIGGGTTDLALIRLTLEEINPFEPDEDRGDGGRYYKLTPKLLGSSGHMQLGGELITLEIFRLLKASIADCLLTAVAEDRLDKNILKVPPESLSPRFLNNGKFQKGALLACVETKGEEDAYDKALKDAEKVLPTHWTKLSSRLQTFYTLWEYAEEAKLQLGQNPQKDAGEPIFVLDGQKIAELLQQNNIDLPSEVIDSLKVELTVGQFEKAAIPHIKEAIGIAEGLVENTFKSKPSTSNNSQEKDDSQENKQQLNWLILSGKTCNFPLVKRELYQVFSKSDYFVWNDDRITFEPEYTKLATSAGACLAEKFRQLSFDPRAAIDLLRKGANQLYIDVKNLFYFLPCSFEREVMGEAQKTIFQTGDPLYQLQADDEVAKCRSNWQGMQLTNNIRRKDFENRDAQFWGGYNGEALRRTLNINEYSFKELIKVQFEINQQLDIELLLCWGNPHYLIPSNTPDIPYLDLTKVIGTPPVISQEGERKKVVKVVCDIAVHVAESANAMQTDGHTVVFEAGKDYSEKLTTFKNDDGDMESQGGLVEELPPFPLSGKHTFYFQFRSPESNQWELIGQLTQPEVRTDFPYKHYVSLNEKGILRVHAFEVPYWTSDKLEDLANKGCVVRQSLVSKGNQLDPKRNPFSGEH